MCALEGYRKLFGFILKSKFYDELFNGYAQEFSRRYLEGKVNMHFVVYDQADPDNCHFEFTLFRALCIFS